MGPQQPVLPERIPRGPSPEQTNGSGVTGQTLPPDAERPREREAPQEGRHPAPADRLNTVPGSGNTTNNPDNNITARTLEEGAGLER